MWLLKVVILKGNLICVSSAKNKLVAFKVSLLTKPLSAVCSSDVSVSIHFPTEHFEGAEFA
jgi:hypothetical protein